MPGRDKTGPSGAGPSKIYQHDGGKTPRKLVDNKGNDYNG